VQKQRIIGVVTAVVLVVLAVALVKRRGPGPSAEACEIVVERHVEHHGADTLERREPIVDACIRYATPAYVECAREASDAHALARCAEDGLRPHPSHEAPTQAACEDQADWRIAMHQRSELPSIAAGIADTRDSMIETCVQSWSAEYVRCLRGSPSLAFAQACETVGRAR
jgi:hypothetical protein